MAAANVFDVENLPIADLRKLAAKMNIESQKDWDKSMYINAINSRRKSRKVCKVVEDPNSEEIPVGFARIRLHLTPQGTDWPVDVMVNNFRTSLLRNVWIDVPREVRDQLRQSTELVPRVVENSEGHKVVKMVAVPCYPFDQIGETAGDSGAIRPNGDAKVQTIREKYRELYGRWPRRAEQQEFMKMFIEEFQQKKIREAVDNNEL